LADRNIRYRLLEFWMSFGISALDEETFIACRAEEPRLELISFESEKTIWCSLWKESTTRNDPDKLHGDDYERFLPFGNTKY
jgi:hypothetical protein